MDNFLDDLGDDDDGGGDDVANDGSCDDDFSELESDGDDYTTEANDGTRGFPEWQDWMIIGPLSEELTRERQEREWLKRKNQEMS